MTITNGYATLNDLKTRLNIEDGADNASLEKTITAVSRWIDWLKQRRFYATTETRYYSPRFPDMLIINDLLSLTTLKTDDDADGTFETTWTSTDYNLEPLNAVANNKPYEAIYTTPDGNYSFPTGHRKSTQIAGSFGYSSTVPPAINEACLLASMRLWKRKDLIFGISGNADMGTLTAITSIVKDGELMQLLNAVEDTVVVF